MEFFVLVSIALFMIVVYQSIKIKEYLFEIKELKETKVVRAKDAKGKFIADDPSTPENEAYVKVPATKSPSATQKKTRRGRKPIVAAKANTRK